MKEKAVTAGSSSFQSYWFHGLDLFMRFKGSDFVRKISQTFVTRVFVAAIGLVTSVLVARILGPEVGAHMQSQWRLGPWACNWGT